VQAHAGHNTHQRSSCATKHPEPSASSRDLNITSQPSSHTSSFESAVIASPSAQIASTASGFSNLNPEAPSAGTIEDNTQQTSPSEHVEDVVEEASMTCKEGCSGQTVCLTEVVDDAAEDDIAGETQNGTFVQGVQVITEKTISQDVEDIINQILEDVQDVSQETSTPKEIHDAAHQTSSATSSPGITSTSTRAHAINSGGGVSPPLDDDSKSIHYLFEGGVLLLKPTPEQWLDFPAILRYAESLGASTSGAFKVLIPEGVAGRGLLGPHATVTQKGYQFSIERLGNDTFRVERKEFDVDAQADLNPLDTSSTDQLIERFETLLENQVNDLDTLKDVYYCADVDAREPATRAKLGLPNKSPIWPLKGDRLPETKKRIPGIHWPFSYQAGPTFGAPFAIHQEDHRLHSINYLYTGQPKVWVIIAPGHAQRLEEKLRATNGSYYKTICEQFVLHSATYVLRSTLDAWGISFQIIRQLPNEAVVTFPRSYHQGFNAGYNLAEAVNYADCNWNILNYRDCKEQLCPAGFIHSKKMCLRNRDEEQEAEENDVSSVDEPVTALMHGVRKRKRQKLEPKTRKKPTSEKAQVSTSEYQSWKKYEMRHDKTLKSLNRPSPSYVRSQPSQIFAKFEACNLDGTLISAQADSLTRILVSIASHDAFYQLRDAYTAIRENQSPMLSQLNGNVAQTIQSLDALDAVASIGSIQRRYQLAHLVLIREERELNCSNHLTQERRTQKIMPRRTAKLLRPAEKASEDPERQYRGAASLALKDMMAEAYPKVEPPRFQTGKVDDGYSKRLKILKNRLGSGRNWRLLQQRFGDGILALIPTDGEYRIKNSE